MITDGNKKMPCASALNKEEGNALLASFGAMPDSETEYDFQALRHLVKELRSDHGCSWDRAQTQETLISFTKGELEEVEAAIHNKDSVNLCEELGDLLFQLVLHVQLAEDEGLFTMEDVLNTIGRKMVRRHPHVFGEYPRELTEEENRMLWKIIKSNEKAADGTALH